MMIRDRYNLYCMNYRKCGKPPRHYVTWENKYGNCEAVLCDEHKTVYAKAMQFYPHLYKNIEFSCIMKYIRGD